MRNASTATVRTTLLAAMLLYLTACASNASDPNNPKIKPRQTLECPYGMVLICESRNEPSRGGDEEIPEYDRCHCELNRV
jgi:hypothetical protein